MGVSAVIRVIVGHGQERAEPKALLLGYCRLEQINANGGNVLFLTSIALLL